VADEGAARETAAQAFVRDRVDVIVAFGNPTIRAARAATSKTPRRVLVVSDPPDPASSQQLAEMRLAAENMKPLQLVERQTGSAAGLERVFESIRPGDFDAALSASVNLHIRFTRLC
jgi:hypothetical protein